MGRKAAVAINRACQRQTTPNIMSCLVSKGVLRGKIIGEFGYIGVNSRFVYLGVAGRPGTGQG